MMDFLEHPMLVSTHGGTGRFAGTRMNPIQWKMQERDGKASGHCLHQRWLDRTAEGTLVVREHHDSIRRWWFVRDDTRV